MYYHLLKQTPSVALATRAMNLLLVLLVATGALAAPWSTRREPERCQGYSRFRSRVFTYNYEGETVSGLVGTSSARSALRIRARVIVKPVSGCQHALKIDSTELWESQSQGKTLDYTKSEKSASFAVELEAHELVFGTRNGVITDLLPHAEEPTRILNIKRGILSTLQAKIIKENRTEDEVDVSGECKASYVVHSRYINRLPKVISKSKNLTECSEHAKTNVGIHVHPYNEKPISLLKSTSNCRFALTAKSRIRQVVCKEEHVFRPFSAGYNATSGAITTTKQVLTLLNLARSSEEPRMLDVEAERMTLKYEHVEVQSTERDAEEVESLITRLARDSMLTTKPESARLFSRLVHSIRKLNVKAMRTVWNRIYECDKEGVCEKEELNKFQLYLLDALPHCGSEGCAGVMSYAIRNELVSGERGNMFLAGLAMVSVPTEQMISDLLILVQMNPSRTGMLTLGTLMHKFCETNPRRCLEKKTVISVTESWLLNRLGERCDAKTADQAEDILLTLKAIGNAGRPVSAQSVLLQCALNGNAPVNVSIAALEAVRRMPCTEHLTEQLLSIYAEHNVDVEIRLAAYLALLNCPSVDLFKQIVKIQRSEVNNQVGSFVWSHLTNAMESTEPVYGAPKAEMVKEALKDMELREFNLNRLRFSRAWEGSFYSDILRAGGSAQGHMIYHPNSYFPRSARMNLTADILGASINVLEAAARFEGFEILVEQFFGDDGYFPDDRIMKMFNLKPHEERDEEEREVNSQVRGRRSLSEDLNKVEKHLNKIHQKMDTRNHHPSGAISVKVFGNEMRLVSFDDISWLQTEADNINMVDFLIKLARGGKKSFTKSFMFLDAETTIPTILGLPLKLHAEGTTVASLEVAGKFDIRNMFWGPMAFEVRGYVKPSAVVEITGRMGVDAVFAEAGILVNSSLYTSTQIKGNATYKQGETFRFEIAAPETPIEIVNISSSLFATLNGKGLAIINQKRIEPSPCLNMTRVLGITACGQLSLPLGFREYESPFFPLSGPASFSLSIKRTDPKLSIYQILATRKPTEDENEYDFIVSMSTPNATWEREFQTNASLWLKKDQKEFSASMGALGYTFGKLEGRYNNISNTANLTFSTKDVVYGYPIVLSGQYFNNSNPEKTKRELGIKWFATFNNYTVSQLTTVYNKSHVYGYATNMSYWQGKYLYSAGELSIPKKSIALVANHTCTKTSVRLDASLGDKENKFHFNFTNKPSRVGIEVTGKYAKSQREAIINMFVKPCRQSFTLRGSFAKAGVEKGVYFKASHDNKNRVVTWYTGIVNATQEKSLKVNASLLGRPMQVMWTYFNFTTEKGLRVNASALSKSVEAVWSYVNFGKEKGLKFNGSALDKTIEAAWTFLNRSNEKVVKFNASALNKTMEATWAFLNLATQKSLTFNATALDKTVQAVWTFMSIANEKSLTFNATGMNKTLQATWSLLNLAKQKRLTFNATVMNKTLQATWSLLNLAEQKKLTFNATVMNKTVQATWSLLNLAEQKRLTFNATVMNKTLQATWSLLNLAKEKSLTFNATVMNKTVQATWNFLNLANEKSLTFNATGMNKTLQATWNFLNFAKQKRLTFNATVMNKTLQASWNFLNLANEKSLTFNATGMSKTVQATWSFLNLANEKSLKFNASAMNKTMEATWTFLSLRKEKSLTFKASALNKTLKAAWTFVNNTREKSLKFNARALDKTIEAAWTFVNFTNEKSLKFHASGLNKSIETAWTLVTFVNQRSLKFNATVLNKTIDAAWTFVNFTNEKSLKFNASAMNKTIETAWTLVTFVNQRSLKFNATVLNKTIEAAWTVVNFTNEKSLKFNASGLNKTMEATWTYLRFGSEKSLKFNARALNKSIEAAWTFVNLTNEKSLKFNASALNKTVETVWTFKNLSNAKAIQFNATVLNKTFVAMWSYLKGDKEKMIKFNASTSNKAMEVAWTFFNFTTEKGLRFNATILNKTFDASLKYFRNLKDMGVRLNVSTSNKSFELLSKMLFQEKGRKMVVSAAYQNYSIAMVGLFQNLTTRKSFCMHPEVLRRSYGEVCLTFTNSSTERSLALNVSAINKSAEVKTEWFKRKTSCATRLTATYNRTTLFESWMSLTNSLELKAFRLNATAANKSIDATWFFQNMSKKAIGMNMTAFGKHIGIKGLWFNKMSYKLAAVHLVWNKTLVAFSALSMFNSSTHKRVEFRNVIGRYVAEIQSEYRVHGDGRHDLLMVRLLRNGSRSVFFDSSRLSYIKAERRREMVFDYNLKVLGRSFQYGWDVAHDNFSSSEVLHQEVKFAVMYSKGKKVSLTSVTRNNTEELSQKLIVEYLPGKTMQHSITWYKPSGMIDAKLELLPKIALTYRFYWNTKKGLSVSSVLTMFNKKIQNSFSFDKELESYNGHVEVCPAYPLDFSGKFSTSNGLLFTSTIEAFKRTWNHVIEINKEERKVFISIEPMPRSPVVFQANWETAEGMKVSMDVSAFRKSLHWEGMYERLTKTLTSDLTVLNQKIAFLESIDVDTKTLTLKLTALKRTIGFIGRFDWKAYVASAHLTYEDKMAGWFLAFNPSSRNIIFNVTLAPTVSGQIVGEMPTDSRLQVTLQRKFGMDIVNESRLVYELKSESSRIFFTWNTTTTTNLVNRVKSVKPMLVNVTMKYYNLAVLKVKNLTKEVDVLVKKLEAKIKPLALKMYQKVKTYDYKRLLQNTSQIARNATLRMFNLTIEALNRTVRNLPSLVRNATKLCRSMYKNATKLYKGMYRNATKFCRIMYKNATKLYKEMYKNATKLYNGLYKNATKLYKGLYKNATKLYKGLCKNATVIFHKLRTEVIPPIVRNITLHLKNITRDLVAWSKNVTLMISNITVRGEKVGDIGKRIAIKVEKITKKLIQDLKLKSDKLIKNITIPVNKVIKNITIQVNKLIKNITIQANKLIKNITIQAEKLMVRIRETEIRGQKLGPVFDKYMVQVRNFTCNFNASCTLKNLTVIAMNVSMRARKMTVLNKTIDQHIAVLRQQVVVMRQQVVILRRQAIHLARNMTELSRNLTKALPQFLRNVSIQTIHLARRLTKDIKNVTLRVQTVTVEAYLVVKNFSGPLVNHLVKVSTSLYYRVKPSALKAIAPVVEYTIAVKRGVALYVKPIVKPVVPLVYNIIYQVRNITVLRVPIGVVLDKAANRSMETAIEMFRLLNHTATTNIGAAIDFVKETSQKTPEEIVDITIMTCQRFCNFTRITFNQTVQLGYNMSKLAVASFNKSVQTLNQTMQKVLKMVPDQFVQVSIQKIQVIAANITAEVLSITKQLRSLDLVKPIKQVWQKMDLKKRIKALELEAKWKRIVERVEALDIKQHVLKFRRRFTIVAVKVLRELREISNVSYRALNLTLRLGRMDITKEEFVKELFSIGNETKRILKKHAYLVKNTTLDVHGRLWNTTLDVYGRLWNTTLDVHGRLWNTTLDVHGRLWNRSMVMSRKYKMLSEQYKRLTVNKTLEAYTVVKEFSLAFYNEHKEDTIKMLNIYKEIALKVYENLKGKLEKKVDALRKEVDVLKTKMTEKVHAVVLKLRQYENMTYEEIVLKVQSFIKKRGLLLYKNVTLKVMELYNKTRMATLKVYNRTLVWVNRTTAMAIEYYNLTRNYSMKYYKMGRNMSVAYYKVARNMSMTYYKVARNMSMTYYKVARNMSMTYYKVARNMSMTYYKVARNMSMTYYKVARNHTIKYYNLTRTYAVKYYRIGRNMSMEYYKLGRNISIVYYRLGRNLSMKYLAMGRNLTLHAYNVTRNFTLRTYGMSLNRTLEVVRYLNKTLVPKLGEYIVKGKFVVKKAFREGTELATFVAREVKEWYEKNKEKTVEELYVEVYTLVNGEINKAMELAKGKLEKVKIEIKGKLEKVKIEIKGKLEKVKIEIQKLNKTVSLSVMNITGEIMSIFNQTANITEVAGKQFVAIFRPCAKVIQNKTITFLLLVKNISLPLIEKAQNIALQKLNLSRFMAEDMYKKFMARKDVQELIVKYQVKERYEKAVERLGQLYNKDVQELIVKYQVKERYEKAVERVRQLYKKDVQELIVKYQVKERYEKAVERVRQLYNKTVDFVKETRPKVEAKLNEIILYVNVTLPRMMSEWRKDFMAKREEIMAKVEKIRANPTEYVMGLLRKALEKMMVKIKDTPIEAVVMHQIWRDYAEEIKQHELIGIGGKLVDYSKGTADVAVQRLKVKFVEMKQKIEELKQKVKDLKTKVQLKAQEVREKVEEKMEDFKKMKLREIVEHQYVFRTIDMVRNATAKAKNFTLEAKNATLKWIAIGKVYARNLTRNVTLQVQILKAKIIEFKKNVTLKFLELKKNVTLKFLELKNNVTLKYQELKKNITLKFLELKKDVTLKYQELKKNITLKFLELKKNVTLKFLELKKNVTLKYQELKKNFTLKFLELKKNVTLKFLELKKNVTLKYQELKKNVTLQIKKYMPIVKNYTTIARNMTIKVWKVARNWTAMQVNASKLWLNRTVEKGRKYYEEKVVPFYKEKVIPYYQNKVVPMYRNYSKMVVEFSKNMTKRAVAMKEEAIKATLESKPYLVLRKVGKMTIRESVLAARILTIQAYTYAINSTLEAYNYTLKAYNYTLNLTSQAINMTMVKYSVSKILLERLMKEGLKSVTPYLDLDFEVLNATIFEIVETAVYVNKYYGIEKSVREKYMCIRKCLQAKYVTIEKSLKAKYASIEKSLKVKYASVEKSLKVKYASVEKSLKAKYVSIEKDVKDLKEKFAKLEKTLRTKISYHVPRLVNASSRFLQESAFNALDLVNNTIRYVNRTIGLLNSTLLKIRYSVPKYIQVRNGVVTLVIPHLRPINGSIKTLSIEAVQKVKTLSIEAVQKVKTLSKEAVQKVKTLSKEAVQKVKTLSTEAVQKVKTLSTEAVQKVKNLTRMALNMSRQAVTKTKMYFEMAKNKSLLVKLQVRILTMKVYNMTRNLKMKAYRLSYNMTTKVYKLSYNFTMKAYRLSYNMTMKVYNLTYNFTMKALNMSRTHPWTRRCYNQTVHFFNLTRKFVKEFNFTKVVNLTKTYIPVALKMSREWCTIGFSSSRNFTVRVAGIVWSVPRDIFNSSSLKEALAKAKIHSMIVYNETLRLYREIYTIAMRKYRELYIRSVKLYGKISKHETVLKSISQARDYFSHSKKIMKMRMRHLRYVKRYWGQRIAHKMNRMSTLLNPINWIPPFNSTAMIFGPSHVYTFDRQYYRFPGYKTSDCMYVLARDVRDNKFKLLSQEKALILLTDDMNVKVHQDGRVDTMTKITASGKKIKDGYDSELPVESANTTVTREGSYIVIKNTLGLEIVCDMKHDMCTFNIARWFHGRLAGLLGTNNNEFHDEWLMSDNKPTRSKIDFVNSWEVTKDPKCHISENEVVTRQCQPSSYSKRCREIFKDMASPLAPFFNVTDPKPFLKACEYDYTHCETKTPKDMRHCNTTAAYIDLLRMEGEWVEYLPECGRCAQHEVGQRWFQSSNKMVDVVLLVPETPSMRNFANKLPEFVTSLTKEMSKYSFQFGVVGYGGENIHSHPHMVTVNGQLFGSADQLETTIKHLKFPIKTRENSTIDNVEAISVASRYPFRAGATKIFLLLTGEDKETTDVWRLMRVTRMLQAQDITLNILGKYGKLRGDFIGQDYKGKVYYRKALRGTGSGVSLPAGELVEIMKNTEGSVFGLSFLVAEDEMKFKTVALANANAWKEQIKRDQIMCKECFCARGDAGQGKSICKINTFHKC